MINLRAFYSILSSRTIKVIEYLLWMGMANVYQKFDSEVTIRYLDKLIRQFDEIEHLLPDPNIVKNLTVEVDNGWGKKVDIGKIR